MLLILDENMVCVAHCGLLTDAPRLILKHLVQEDSKFENDEPITEQDHILFRTYLPYGKDVPEGLPTTDLGFRLAVYILREGRINDTRLSVVQVIGATQTTDRWDGKVFAYGLFS